MDEGPKDYAREVGVVTKGQQEGHPCGNKLFTLLNVVIVTGKGI